MFSSKEENTAGVARVGNLSLVPHTPGSQGLLVSFETRKTSKLFLRVGSNSES